MGFELINAIKKKKGLTNEKLAEISGVPKATIDKITSGATTNPNFDTVWALADALGCSVDDFKQKKSPAPAEPEAGDFSNLIDEKELALFRQTLVDLGYVREGDNLTHAQADILFGVFQILNATFPRATSNEISDDAGRAG